MMYNKENQLVVYQKSLGAVFQTREPFSGQWTLQRFFQVFIKTCKQISINTAGKRALKLWNLPSSNVIRPKRAKILLHKVAEFYKRLYGGGHELAPSPHHRNGCKISRLFGPMSSWVLNKFESWQHYWFQGVRSNRDVGWSQSKVEKTVEWSMMLMMMMMIVICHYSFRSSSWYSWYFQMYMYQWPWCLKPL